MAHLAPEQQDVRRLLAEAAGLMKRKDWDALAALEERLPEEFDHAWAEVAEEVAFALGQLRETTRAARLLERCWEVEPTWRRASALAYAYYDAALRLRNARRADADDGAPDRETLREGFRRWIGEALRLFPGSIKDLYRLGVFEAQVESRRDKVALRAFLGAIDSYRKMSDEERERRHDLRKYVAKSLYAGGRSALRLGRPRLARKLSFECIRFDGDTDHVEPVFKLALAGKVCLATGELDHAERALRMALDAEGPPRRDWLYGLLAGVELGRGDGAAAVRWIETHVRPERRSPALWRRLGDAHRVAGDVEKALAAWESALRRDRTGKHLTFTRIGEAHLERGAWRRAEKAFRKAIEFRRRRYLSDHAPALLGLERALRERGRREEAVAVRKQLAKVRPAEPLRDDQEVA